ncbi:MAG: FAD/NAD(P)-binding protein [Nitrospinae bacterium]|nr:FAD/NAD(P)-binding protein [Nitrospinota bacterium]
MSDIMTPEPYVIKKTWVETYDTFSLSVAPARNGGGPPKFSPGQFNMLYVFGVGEVPISISGDPAENSDIIHTVRAVGAVTNVMRDLKKGDYLGLRGPFGNGWPVKDAEGHDVLIIAGGIALAPLRPAIYHVLANREKYGKVTLLYGARSAQDILYTKELEQWRSGMDVLVTVDRGGNGWKGEVGVVTRLIGKARFDPLHTMAFVCGPEIMMRYTVMELARRQVAAGNIMVSMERSMRCGVGLCGFCQFGPHFVCKNGPVFRYSEVSHIFTKREV